MCFMALSYVNLIQKKPKKYHFIFVIRRKSVTLQLISVFML